MKQYLEWLEKQIDFCLEDKTMQREHWAFCKAYDKFKSLETTAESEKLTPHIEYHDNGNVWVKGQKNQYGRKEGLWEYFYKNGKIHWRIPYKNGKEDGIAEWFYKNGNIYMRTPHKEGKRDGIEERFYESRNIKARIPYKEGKEDGIEAWFDERGNIVETQHWKDGELDRRN